MVDMLNSMHNIGLVGPKKLGSSSCPLPDDVFTEILSYLPAKAFFRLLSISNAFCKLLSDSFPPFIIIP
ncbi:hypothetical protein MUK42_11971 [Musa troglodytarum]|uniref:F-box domain-containing protein n=1 Tax=Musa troglodytarum TaxID=320322 RepID=A0A9E7FD11_9LILI|nr:hypothetical protein MUK42_11971 [Musa troglodytarum]